jgi:hypothetical protein
MSGLQRNTFEWKKNLRHAEGMAKREADMCHAFATLPVK